MAPLGYDAMMILGQAINTAGSTDGTKIRDALASVKDYPGVTGVITIDEKRNAKKAAVVLEVRGSKANFVASVPP
jgi:branched-chain amino acid transport system substrate-binding protein